MKGRLEGRTVILENGKIIDIIIALYKMKKGEITEIFINKKSYSYNKLLEFIKKEMKDVYDEYKLFEYLNDLEYFTGAGFKFGSLFRVYDKGEDPKKHHSKWILYIVKKEIGMDELSSKMRVAHSTRKKLLLYLDNRFVEVSWKKL